MNNTAPHPGGELLANIHLLHTTELGAQRIRRGLLLAETEDVVEWCRKLIADERAVMERAGKNWYVTKDGCRITVNAHSYTIITAHKS